MRDVLQKSLAVAASLRVTVVLLAMSMVLIFAGTLAQVEQGIWQVMDEYFRSPVVWLRFDLFLPGTYDVPGALPFPGGALLGALVLANLLAAHAVRFKLRAKRTGILLVHASLILLLLGEGLTAFLAVEKQMPILEGRTITWAQDIRSAELVVVDRSHPEHDVEVSIPTPLLAEAHAAGEPVTHPELPFAIRVEAFHPNAALLREPAGTGPQATAGRATAGLGTRLGVRPLPKATGVGDQTVDSPAAYVTPIDPDTDEPLGTYLVSADMISGTYEPVLQPVAGTAGDVGMAMRFRRYNKPYSLTLIDFRHDLYPGTNVPKNFSSDVRLTDPRFGEDRALRISMNSPLRYRGETFYQSSFLPEDAGTVLQVVDNPGWWVPYVACAMGGAGLVIHFGISLVGFLKRRGGAAERTSDERVSVAGARTPSPALPAAAPVWARWLPWVAVAIAGVWLLGGMVSAVRGTGYGQGPFDLQAYGRIPVVFEGRHKPMSGVARDALTVISGRQTTPLEHRPAIDWLLELQAAPERAAQVPVFRIDHPEVLALIGQQDSGRKFFSYAEIYAHAEAFIQQDRAARAAERDQRSLFQRKVLELSEKLRIYTAMVRGPAPEATPSAVGLKPWAVPQVQAAISAFAAGDELAFNAGVAEVLERFESEDVALMTRAGREAVFRHFAPFYRASVLYVFAGVLALVSWLVWPRPLQAMANRLLVLTLLVHTVAIAVRIYLSGRPPVTNLYSSAVFVGWGAVLLGVVLEYLGRGRGLGTVVAAAAGFGTLLIARGLDDSGDTMAVLQAVLDTNFWLATHVVVITLGYSAVFVAGLLGIIYILRGVFIRAQDPVFEKRTTQMIYGTVCFGLLFSFVGTVLGGIWADQSWGRFWGWDPKENGALMIVIWCAIILHARWGGMARGRGIAVMAVFGNIVTSWSWFGVNMLGVGLHSYGFMDAAFFWLLAFVVSQLLVIGVGLLPRRLWRSGHDLPGPPPPARKAGESRQLVCAN